MKLAEFIEAGKIVNTHGIAGQVKIEVWLDSPNFLKKFSRCYIDGREVRIDSSTVQKNFLLSKLEGVDDINAAMTLKGKVVYIAREDAGLKEGEYFLCDIIGAKVIDEAGKEIGILESIEEYPAAPVYVVRGNEEHLIPGIPEFIKKADPENGLLTVHLIEGM